MGKKHVNNKSTHFVTANGNRIESKIKSRLTKDKESITNGEQTLQLNNKQKAEVLIGKRILVKCKNKTQKDFVQMISEKEIILCKGPAGVGKSYLSVVQALHLLQSPDTMFEKIIIITPAIESDGERLGALPGNVAEKLDPYLFSTYYLIDELIGKKNREILVEKGIIQPIAFAFLRGINIDRAILIGEEIQNVTKSQMKTLITRIGYNSKFILSGDLEQIDRFDKKESGLADAFNRLKGIEKIGFFSFGKEDIVRNPMIGEILNKYND